MISASNMSPSDDGVIMEVIKSVRKKGTKYKKEVTERKGREF